MFACSGIWICMLFCCWVSLAMVPMLVATVVWRSVVLAYLTERIVVSFSAGAFIV